MSAIGCRITGKQALKGMPNSVQSDCPRFPQLLKADWACWIRLPNGLLNFEKPFNEVKSIWLNQATASWAKMHHISPRVSLLHSLFHSLQDILSDTLSYHKSTVVLSVKLRDHHTQTLLRFTAMQQKEIEAGILANGTKFDFCNSQESG